MKGAGKIGAFIAVLVLAGATANPGYAQDAEHGKRFSNLAQHAMRRIVPIASGRAWKVSSAGRRVRFPASAI
jgi:hypothetical protein